MSTSPNCRWLGALGTVDAIALWALRPDLTALRAALSHPSAQLAERGTDAVVTTVSGSLLWTLAGWLAIGLLAVTVSAVPGAVGLRAATLAGALLPRTVLRLVAGAAGLGIVLAPVAAGATSPGRSGPVMSAAVVVPRVPSPTWPTDTVATPSLPSTTGGTLADQHHPPARHSSPAQPAPREQHSEQPDPAPARVTVRSGDTLWQIAARELPGHPSAHAVAASWPRWFAANRRVIGADPNRIVPGQVLHAPSAAANSRSPR